MLRGDQGEAPEGRSDWRMPRWRAFAACWMAVASAGCTTQQAASEATSCSAVSLKIESTGQQKRSPLVEATLTNLGELPVKLVEPGDNSDVGRRTPIVTWTLSPDTGRILVGGCGNINHIRREEVFTLHPGETHRLSWISAPPLRPGVYRLQLQYENDPLFFATGPGAIGPEEPISSRRRIVSPEVQRMIETTADCLVTSNVIEVVVQ